MNLVTADAVDEEFINQMSPYTAKLIMELSYIAGPIAI